MDEASFDPKDVIAVFGDPFECLLTGATSGVECHHIYGRGGKHNREVMSSIYNCAPLRKYIHAKGWINRPEARNLFRMIVEDKVQEAIQRGFYKHTSNDQDFISFISV